LQYSLIYTSFSSISIILASFIEARSIIKATHLRII